MSGNSFLLWLNQKKESSYHLNLGLQYIYNSMHKNFFINTDYTGKNTYLILITFLF